MLDKNLSCRFFIGTRGEHACSALESSVMKNPGDESEVLTNESKYKLRVLES